MQSFSISFSNSIFFTLNRADSYTYIYITKVICKEKAFALDKTYELCHKMRKSYITCFFFAFEHETCSPYTISILPLLQSFVVVVAVTAAAISSHLTLARPTKSRGKKDAKTDIQNAVMFLDSHLRHFVYTCNAIHISPSIQTLTPVCCV